MSFTSNPPSPKVVAAPLLSLLVSVTVIVILGWGTAAVVTAVVGAAVSAVVGYWTPDPIRDEGRRALAARGALPGQDAQQEVRTTEGS